MTPELIDTSVTETGLAFQGGQYYGPFVRSGALYVAIVVFTSGSSLSGTPQQIGMFKSVDDGATWVEQDVANRPSNTRFSTESVFYPAAGGDTLYFSYADFTTLEVVLQNYDFSIDAWGSPIAGGPSPIFAPGPFRTGARLSLLSGGDIIVVYEKITGGKLQIFWAKYNGGWSNVDTLISTNTDGISNADLLQVHSDANDIVHVWFGDAVSFPHIFYTNLIGTTLLSIQTIYTSSRVNTSAAVVGRAIYFAATDEIIVPFRDHTDAGNFFRTAVAVLRGTPSNNPTFTKETVRATYRQITDQAKQFPFMIANSDESVLYCWYGFNDGDAVDDNASLRYQTQTAGVGAWSAATVFYDEVVDPPVPLTGFLSTTIFSVTRTSDAPTFRVVIGLDNFHNGAEFCDLQYYLFTPSVNAVRPFFPQYIRPRAVRRLG